MTKRIAFVLYTKNDAEYLRDFLFSVLLKTIESDLPECSFHYYFYENDSTDDTVSILREWQVAHPERTTIMSETVPCASHGSTTGRDYDRIARMTTIRNRFLNKYRTELVSNYDYVWFLDSSIFTCAEDIAEMLKIIEGDRDIAMVTCNTLETIENNKEVAELYDAPPPSVVPFITTNHYYDTYAFLSIDNRSYYPNCTSPDCKYQRCRELQVRERGMAPIEVRSAWGGSVIIDAEVLKPKAVRWSTFAWSDSLAPCEHIYFCDMIRAFWGRKIVIAPNIKPLWIST